MVERHRRGQQFARCLRRRERCQHGARRDAQRLQQPHQQERLVLAVAVAVAQHLGRRVRPVRALAERRRVVADLALHPLQRLRGLLRARRQSQPARDLWHEFGWQRFVLREQAIGPARHLAPVGELAELQPAQRDRAARQHRLEFDGGEVAFLEAQAAHAVAQRDLRGEPGCVGVAVPLPLHRPGIGGVERDAAQLHWHRPLPRHALAVAAAEDRVRALDRILQVQGVADADVGEQHARGDHAAVDALLQPGLALQEAHLCRRRLVEHLIAAKYLHLVQHQFLVLRDELHRDLPDLPERARVVDLLRDVDEDHRLLGDQQMGVLEPHRESAAGGGRRRDRQHVGPGRQRGTANERGRGDGNFFQRRLGGHRRAGRRSDCRGLRERRGRDAEGEQTRNTPGNGAEDSQGRLVGHQMCPD